MRNTKCYLFYLALVVFIIHPRLTKGGWLLSPHKSFPATPKPKRKGPKPSKWSIRHPLQLFWWKKNGGTTFYQELSLLHRPLFIKFSLLTTKQIISPATSTRVKRGVVQVATWENSKSLIWENYCLYGLETYYGLKVSWLEGTEGQH